VKRIDFLLWLAAVTCLRKLKRVDWFEVERMSPSYIILSGEIRNRDIRYLNGIVARTWQFMTTSNAKVG
jgi:uncharacterized protein YjaG (DUF416 family)